MVATADIARLAQQGQEMRRVARGDRVGSAAQMPPSVTVAPPSTTIAWPVT